MQLILAYKTRCFRGSSHVALLSLVLGSSLGAQAAGYVGHFTGGSLIIMIIMITFSNHYNLKRIFQDGNLSRITGLDPSGPLICHL